MNGTPPVERSQSKLSKAFLRVSSTFDHHGRSSFSTDKPVHEELSPERAALREFKALLQERGITLPPAMVIAGDADATLMRFLRARKLHLPNTLAMLEKSLQWRQEVGADTALERPIGKELTTLIRECRPSSYIGFNREGYPVFVERLGHLDTARIEATHLTDAQLLTYHVREMEFMAQVVMARASEQHGHTVDKVVTIMDAAGVKLSSLSGNTQRLFRALMSMDSDNYPECCATIYVVNAGAVFATIWRVLQPFVDKGTRDKVKVLGGGKHMQQVLLEAFGPELLPSFLGGALDYEVTTRTWQAWLDTTMAEAQKLATVLGPTASSAGGLYSHLRLRLPRPPGQPDSPRSESDDGWRTPLSVASRTSSVTSAASFYYDAIGDVDASPRSSYGGSPPALHQLSSALASAAAAPGGSPPSDHRATPRSGVGGAAGPAAAGAVAGGQDGRKRRNGGSLSEGAEGEGRQPRCQCVIS